MTKPKRKFKVYQEEAKTRQTSHWDWDYMSTAELEELMQERREREQAEKTDQDEQNQRPDTQIQARSRLLKLWAVVLAVIVLSIGVLLAYLD